MTVMRILALETSTPACSVALSSKAQIRQDFRIAPRQHNRLLLHMVDNLLRSMAVSLDSLDLLAFARGPGSFTGLRIGAAVAQGLSMPNETPMIGVSTLEILAHTGLVRASEQGERASEIYPGVIAVLESRPGEIYLGGYACAEQNASATETTPLLPVIEDCVLTKAEVKIPEKCRDWLLVGQCQDLPGAEMLHPLPNILPEASALLALAEQKFHRGETANTANLELVYPRGSAPWKKHLPA